MVDKNSLFNKMWLVATQQILLPIISIKMSQIISETKIDPILVTSILQFGT